MADKEAYTEQVIEMHNFGDKQHSHQTVADSQRILLTRGVGDLHISHEAELRYLL